MLPTDNLKLPEILVIDDDPAMVALLSATLQNANYTVTKTNSLDAARSEMEKRFYPIVLCDINLGKNNGLDLLKIPRENTDKQFYIFITGDANVNTAMTAIKNGAFEYLSKPSNLEELERELLSTIKRATERLHGTDSVTVPIETQSNEPPLKRIVGKSLPMLNVYRAIANSALHRGNVLILGETGTGKEQIARTIHSNSEWASKPFVAVNCGALTDTLLESELFGHVKGSFTGATCNKRGLFEEATDGTIFLDEIGDISLSLQVKLLRAIQEKEIKPVGSSETKHINVRIIAATNRNLEQDIKELKFREDLYFRLKGFLVHVPPLRERLDDLYELVEYFVKDASYKMAKPITGIADGVLPQLMQYKWPGNIRELENAVSRAVVSARSSILFMEDFPKEITQKEKVVSDVLSAEPSTLDEFEKEHILATLRMVNYKKSKAAEILGINRVTLYRKLSRYGIPVENNDQTSN